MTVSASNFDPKNLLNLSPQDAHAAVAEFTSLNGLPGYRTAQIHQKLWHTPVASWDDATDLPKALRHTLAEAFPLLRLDLSTERLSADGTRKYLWRLPDGETIESVLIPSGRRRTLCISSQAGCALGCIFCATGRMGFGRDLQPWEIAGQVREILLRDVALAPTNIVFMGMGEPLLNWPAVDQTLSILNDPSGMGIGARHITISTVGIVPGMLALARRPEQFRLALSIHSARPSVRQRLMPIERKYPVTAVVEAAQAFTRRITVEYVLIRGENDSDEEALALATLARQLGSGALVNLLPLHPGGAPDLAPTPLPRIQRFAAQVASAGVEVAIRRSRGLDIEAACGQLRTVVTSPHAKAGEPSSVPVGPTS